LTELVGSKSMRTNPALKRLGVLGAHVSGSTQDAAASTTTSTSRATIRDDLHNYKGRNYAFVCPIEIRFNDTDANGHVNNVAYFSFFESARVKHIKHLGADPGMPSAENFIQPVLVSTGCRYKAQVGYEDEVVVGVNVEEATEFEYRQNYALFNVHTQRVVAEGHGVIAFIDINTGTRVAVPGNVLTGMLESQSV
jgi:acyl-CoA thioester hydrolase